MLLEKKESKNGGGAIDSIRKLSCRLENSPTGVLMTAFVV